MAPTKPIPGERDECVLRKEDPLEGAGPAENYSAASLWPEPRVELVDQLFGGIRDHRAGREDRLGAGLVQRVVILRRHHAADHDHDVVAAVLLQLGLEFRHRR